jgi:CheY-like chemotaxis protein
MTAFHPKPLVLLASRATEQFRDLETALLSGGFRVVSATNEREALVTAKNHQPHAIVLDAELAPPGYGMCNTLRSDQAVSASTPIVLTRAAQGRLDRLEAFRSGAWEVQAAVDPEELLLRLKVFVEARLEIARLSTECLIDRPTGLYNAHGLEKRAEELSALTMRKGLALACAVFRPSELAERAEREELGRVFKAAGRNSDALGRTDRDEFAVFAPATTSGGASRMVGRLTTIVERDLPHLRVRGAYSSSLAAQKVAPQVLLSRARNALEQGPPVR